MEEASWNGTAGEVKDSSGTPYHHGRAYGDATTVDSGLGMLGRSGSFDGSGDYVNVGNSSHLNPASAITLEGWIKPKSLGDWTHTGSVVARNTAYYLDLQADAILRTYYYYDTGSGAKVGGGWLKTGVLDLSDNWAHVAATSDGQNECIYVNGVLKASQSQTSSRSLWETTAYATNVGRARAHATDSRHFTGLLDEVGVHSRLLTLQEVRQQARMPDLLELCMDDPSWNGTPNEVIDSSSRGHHGRAYGGATTVDDSSFGMLGRSGSFDGISEYVDLGKSIDLNPSGAITLEAWISPQSISGWSHSGIVVGRNTAYYLQVNEDGTVRSYYYYDNGSGTKVGGGWLATDVLDISDEWGHVVPTCDGQNEYIYVNGVLKASQSQTSSRSLWQATRYATNVGRLRTNDRHFTGLIDQVGIYSWALDEQDILYRHSLGVPEPTTLVLLGAGLLALRRRKRR